MKAYQRFLQGRIVSMLTACLSRSLRMRPGCSDASEGRACPIRSSLFKSFPGVGKLPWPNRYGLGGSAMPPMTLIPREARSRCAPAMHIAKTR